MPTINQSIIFYTYFSCQLEKRLPTFLSHFRNLELKQPSNINQFHELFSMLYSIPKGILQHIHLVCCQDDQFVTKLNLILVIRTYFQR